MATVRRPNRAFTLIELLVVIAIISLLVSILLPSLTRAKRMARDVICASNMRNVGHAWIIYASEHDGVFPVSDGYAPWTLNGIVIQQEKKEAMSDYYGGNGHIFYCPLFRSAVPGAEYTYEGRWDHPILTPVTTNCHFYAGMQPNDGTLNWTHVAESLSDPGAWLLVGDWTEVDSNWANHVEGGECLWGTPDNVRGANWCYVDGHVEWTGGKQLTDWIPFETGTMLLPETPDK